MEVDNEEEEEAEEAESDEKIPKPLDWEECDGPAAVFALKPGWQLVPPLSGNDSKSEKESLFTLLL